MSHFTIGSLVTTCNLPSRLEDYGVHREEASISHAFVLADSLENITY